MLKPLCNFNSFFGNAGKSKFSVAFDRQMCYHHVQTVPTEKHFCTAGIIKEELEMKKIIGMVLALAMVLSLATVAFAAGTQSDPEIVTIGSMSNAYLSQTLDAGAKYYYSYTAEAAGKVSVSVYSEGTWNCVIKCGSKSVTLSSNSDMGNIDTKAGDVVSIEIANNGSASADFSVIVSFAAAGSVDNPEAISKMGSVKITLDSMEHYEHYYSWTASEAGTLKISVSASTDWQFFANVQSGDDCKYGNIHASGEDGDNVTTEKIEVKAGDIVTISLTNMSYTDDNNFTLSLVFTDTDGSVDDGSNPGTGDGIAVALAAMMVSGTAIVLGLKKKEN